jgi:hypothetical protein
MKRQTSGLCLLLSLLFAFWILAPHNVHAVTPQPVRRTAMPNLDETQPFIVDVNSARIGRYATAEEAYKTARSYLATAEAGSPIAFADEFGHARSFTRISIIEIFRWNPITGERVRHARSWRRTWPAPCSADVDPLTPLPADWHLCELPADWYDGAPQ